METKNLDVVYFVKDGISNEELRYSIRSVCKNMPFNRIWIFGGCPKNIVPDVRIRVKQEGKTKWDKVRNMFIMACENKELSDYFILFNDDFFVMKPTDEIEPWYRSTLEEHIKVLHQGAYCNLLKQVSSELGEGALSYEVHTPFIFNKKKLLKLIKDTPELHCTRTMYGNRYKIKGTKHHDIKLFGGKPNFNYKEEIFLSTDDGSITPNHDAWRYIKKQFQDKCEYEI